MERVIASMHINLLPPSFRRRRIRQIQKRLGLAVLATLILTMGSFYGWQYASLRSTEAQIEDLQTQYQELSFIQSLEDELLEKRHALSRRNRAEEQFRELSLPVALFEHVAAGLDGRLDIWQLDLGIDRTALIIQGTAENPAVVAEYAHHLGQFPDVGAVHIHAVETLMSPASSELLLPTDLDVSVENLRHEYGFLLSAELPELASLQEPAEEDAVDAEASDDEDGQDA